MNIIPEDLKNFFLTSNGLLIQWSIKFGGSNLNLGKMEINSVAGLTSLTQNISNSDDNPSLRDVDTISDEKDDHGHIKPHFDGRSKIYELDSCNGCGKVCLVYKDLKAGVTTSKPEVWFLDCALDWFYLADSFSSYFRMMIIHLGLPLWQFIFTSSGISPETKQWFNLYAPMRLALDAQLSNHDTSESPSNNSENKLDINRLFRGKGDKSKGRQAPSKKSSLPNRNASTSQGRTGALTRGMTR
ncbi:tubulin polyglutamylase complex subunit 2 isoform X2 [Exaiptasia diaphana]|nr:tubulin polyglutamylase complex subunit 2 isoform X2 [Exaiptasia diaphana]